MKLTPKPALNGGWLAGMLIATAVVFARAESEDRITKSFNVGRGGALVMDVDRGSIDVTTGGGGDVEVEVIRKAGSFWRAKGEEVLRQHEIEITQHGDDIRIHSEFKGGSRWRWFGGRQRLSVRYVIVVPKSYNADLKTSGGSISVSDLNGKVKAKSSGGGLRFGDIGGTIWGRTSGGSIALGGCKQSVDLQTSGGSVTIGDTEGSVLARTSGGSIRIHKAKGEVIAKTSGGGIDVREVFGRIEASTSGGSISARLTSQPKGDCSLRTSGGSIDVRLPEDIAVNLDARTSGGRVSTDLPVTVAGELSKTALRSKLNGGGPALILETSGGSVRIRKL